MMHLLLGIIPEMIENITNSTISHKGTYEKKIKINDKH